MNLSRAGALLIAAIAISATGLGCKNGRPITAREKTSSKITVVASGDTQGWLIPCGCTSNQSGGLLRRGAYLAALRKSTEVILVEVGGAAAGSSPYDKVKLEAIISGELAMGVIAHNLGASEVALGPEYLREIATKLHAPFVSANLRDASGKLVAVPFLIQSVGDRSVAIIGVIASQFATSECKISDPRQAVLDVLGKLPKKVDSLIVLAYLPEAELKELAAQLPEVDLVIGGPTGQCLAPSKVGPVQFASATNKGKFLISFAADSALPPWQWSGNVTEMTEQFPDEESQLKNLAAFRKRLSDLDFSAAQSGLGPLSNMRLPKQFEVAGSTACKQCHAAEFQQWEGTSHFHALKTLERKGAEMDSFCQRCHVNAFGIEGGFASAKKASEHGAVGCESCHGPSRPHVVDQSIKTPFVAKQQCKLCHDHENSPEFEYSKYWAKIAHGGAAAKARAPSVKETP